MMMKPADRSCALAGAMTVTMEIQDCITILHGPSGCCHRFPLGRVADPLRVMATGMTEAEVVFGGEGLLAKAIRKADERRPNMIAVISSCIAGVIGDDVVALCGELKTDSFLLAIPADGFLTGGFYAGIEGAMTALLGDFLPKSPGPIRANTVNILGEKNLAVDEEDSFREITRLLGHLGLKVGTRFVRQTNAKDLQEVGRACLNIVRDPRSGSLPAKLLQDAYGTPYLDGGYPSGRRETAAWLREIARLTGSSAEEGIHAEQARYEYLIGELRKDLAGIRAAVGSPWAKMPWLLELLDDLRMEQMVLPEGGFAGLAFDLILALGPQGDHPPGCTIAPLPIVPPAGYTGPLALAAAWRRKLRVPAMEGWRYDARR